MTPFLAFRLELWREIHARWGLLLLGPAALTLGAAVPAYYRGGWDEFLLLVILPLQAALLAARGSGRADPFWRGLRGPPAARVAAFVVLHLGILLLVGMLAWTRLVVQGGDTSDGATLGGGLALPLHVFLAIIAASYGAVAATRALTSGPSLLLGTVPAALALGLCTAAGYLLQLWPSQGGLVARLLALAFGGLGLAWWWERRVGLWGAAVARRGRWHGPLALLGFLALCVGAEAAARQPFLPCTGVEDMSPDGRRVLRITTWQGWGSRGGRAWLWEDGKERLLPFTGVKDGTLGPNGAYALRLYRGSSPPTDRDPLSATRSGIPLATISDPCRSSPDANTGATPMSSAG